MGINAADGPPTAQETTVGQHESEGDPKEIKATGQLFNDRFIRITLVWACIIGRGIVFLVPHASSSTSQARDFFCSVAGMGTCAFIANAIDKKLNQKMSTIFAKKKARKIN